MCHRFHRRVKRRQPKAIGTTPFTFTVSRSGILTGSTTVNWTVTASATGTSANAADFAGGAFPGGSVSFSPGQAEKTVTVNVAGDTVYESGGAAERFTVRLSNASGGALIATASATGRIQNDDVAPTTLVLAATDADKFEGNSGTTPFTFTVTRSGVLTGSTSVEWAVATSSVSPSADAIDFAASGLLPSGAVSFAPGETASTITVSVAADTDIESDGVAENFVVRLLTPSTGSSITVASAAGVIRNDDASGSDTGPGVTMTIRRRRYGTDRLTGESATTRSRRQW
jgi:hypothetical protein